MRTTLHLPVMLAVLAGGAHAHAQATLGLENLGERRWRLVMDDNPASGTYQAGPLAGCLRLPEPLHGLAGAVHSIEARERQVLLLDDGKGSRWPKVFTLQDDDGRVAGVQLRVELDEVDGPGAAKAELVLATPAKGQDQVWLELLAFTTAKGLVIVADDFSAAPAAHGTEAAAAPLETKTPAVERKEAFGVLPQGPGDQDAVQVAPDATLPATPVKPAAGGLLPAGGAYDAARACRFGQDLTYQFRTPEFFRTPDAAPADAAARPSTPVPAPPSTPTPGVFYRDAVTVSQSNLEELDRMTCTADDLVRPITYLRHSAWGGVTAGVFAEVGAGGPTLEPGDRLTWFMTSPGEARSRFSWRHSPGPAGAGRQGREPDFPGLSPRSPLARTSPELGGSPRLVLDLRGLQAAGGADITLFRPSPEKAAALTAAAPAVRNLEDQGETPGLAGPADDAPPPLHEDW